MQNDSQKLNILRSWVGKAEDDFRMASYAFKMAQDCPYASLCFHVQQCVEKYIKSLLVFHEIDFPKTHDIGHLIQMLPPNIKLPIDSLTQELLTSYAVTIRYPGDDEPVSVSEVKAALSVMRKVRKTVRSFLPAKVLLNARKNT